MASSWLKTFGCILYGLITFLLLCAALVIILKENKSSCPKTNMTTVDISKLIHDTNTSASENIDKKEVATEKPVNFLGDFELTESDNFDEFLTELGIGYFTRLAATAASSKYHITKDGDSYTLVTDSTFGTQTIVFKDGVPFKENRLDGQTVTSTVNIKGNKWIQKQVGEGPDVHIIREFEPEQIKVTSIVNDVASVRIYKRLK